jgi:hypothetical protein
MATTEATRPAFWVQPAACTHAPTRFIQSLNEVRL